MSNRVKIVIPARYGSTRLPGKPLADICGKPMIIRVCERVTSALPNIELIVATDDQRIADAVKDNGYRYFLSKIDHVSGTDRIAEVATAHRWSGETKIINVQGDEPLVPLELLTGFYKYIESIQSLRMATVACRFDSVEEVLDTSKVKLVVSTHGGAMYFSRAPVPFNRELGVCGQTLPLYRKHLGVYAYSVSTLKKIALLGPTQTEISESLEQLRALENGVAIKVYDSKLNAPPGVDMPADLLKVREIFRSINEAR